MNNVLPKSKLRRTEDPFQYFAFQLLKQALADIRYAQLPASTYRDRYWGRQAMGWIVGHYGTYNLVLYAVDIEPFDYNPSHFHSWCLKTANDLKGGKVPETIDIAIE